MSILGPKEEHSWAFQRKNKAWHQDVECLQHENYFDTTIWLKPAVSCLLY